MAAGSQQYAITDTASVIASVPAGSVVGPVAAVWIGVPSADVYVGGDNVSSDNGFLVASADGSVPLGPIVLYPGDVLYAVTATTATLPVLQT